jgi:uncharacterized protein
MASALHWLAAGHSGSELLFLLASAFMAGLARGFSGFGAALIFVPLGSIVVGPVVAAPLLLIIDAIAALGLIPGAWRLSDRRSVAIMAIGAVVGVPLGTAVLVLVDPLTVRWIISVMVFALLLLLASGWRYHGKPSAFLTVCVGTVSGLLSGAAQIGGAPVVVYWLGGANSNAIVRANILAYFAFSTVVTGVSYLIGGLFTLPVLILAITTCPIYGVGLYLGSHLFGRSREATFRWICLGLIAMAALGGLPVLDRFKP